MRNVVAIACVAALTIFAPLAVSAQSDELQRNEKLLATIEGSFGQVQAAKADETRDKEADILESALATYAKAMLASFDAAMGEASKLAKTEGKEGNPTAVSAFEAQASDHAKRLESIDSQARKLLPKAGWLFEPMHNAPASALALLGSAGSVLVTPAEAAIAIPVAVACTRKPINPVACAQAVATAVAQGNAARQSFNDCWNAQENVRPKWWRTVKRLACTAALVARLA
jgi:hypothetical protein